MQRRKRRIKTYAEVATLQHGEFYLSESTGVYLYFEDTMVGQQIFLEDLLDKFYRINYEQPPLVVQLMDGHEAIPEKVWYLVMRGNFYVEVIKGRNHEGPHQVKLWFKSFTTKQAFWIATLQLMAFYFNEKEIKDGILRAIFENEFFMLPSNRKRAIVP